MTALDAITDPTIKERCMTLLKERYDADLADDAWQEVMEAVLSRRTPPTFDTWAKARNYISRAVHNRAKNIYNRMVLHIAESADEFLGDESPVAMVPDTRPNIEEEWIAQENAHEAEAKAREHAYEVRRVIETLPPTVKKTMLALLGVPNEGLWVPTLIRRFKLSPEQAVARIELIKAYKPFFAHLRGHGVPPPPSERTTSETNQTAA